MNFEDWIVQSTRAGRASAIKYSGAVSGRLSSMAIEHGLSNVGLLESKSPKVVATDLKELDEFIARNSTGNSMYSRALDLFIQFLDSGRPSIEDDIAAIIQDPTTTVKEKQRLFKSRIGQGQFRQKLLDMWGCCAVTGCSEKILLIASHIKPWSESTNEERLNPFNGLLLISTLDKAFDSGLISFDSLGKIMISQHFTDFEAAGVSQSMMIQLNELHDEYLNYHRKYVFKGA
ncbi:HNH endonuclease [Photobacterium kagoshimensis]|uniref:HNH endonuclease n=1 Tax=Photobacterium kagoshimensis TaxID=2910242 RepID=UPI003D151DA3